MRKIPKDDWRLQIHNVNANRGQEVRVTPSLSRNLKKRQKDRKMSLVKEEAKEDSEEAVGLIKKVGFQDHCQSKSESCLNQLYSVSDESSIT